MLKKAYIEATSEKPHRHFIEADGAKQVLLGALYVFVLNIGLSVLKVIIAFFSGSLAVAASAVDSTIDSVASLAVLCGLKLSTRKTRTFPYGCIFITHRTAGGYS